MDQSKRSEVIHLWLGGASQRRIAKKLSVSRNTVRQVISDHRSSRDGLGSSEADESIDKRVRKGASKLDAFASDIDQLINRYPDITAVRLHEELRTLGFEGGYTIVRDRLRSVRPQPAQKPIIRFETAPGLQGQMDFSPYTLDFVQEGRRRVHAFSYLLAYSRRQYIRFVEREDFETTLREHKRAFDHLQGVAKVCLYDNMKVVVSHYDGEEPIYNCRFLAFATHYQFRPWACRRYRPRTKGKVERPFFYVEKNLLNARTFNSLEHLNEVTAWWLHNVADVRIHRETKARPIDLHKQEVKHLMPLPSNPYEVAEVVYRVVNTEGYVHWRQNFYPAPPNLIGWLVPVKVTEDEIRVYARDLVGYERHALFPRSITGRKTPTNRKQSPSEGKQTVEALRARFRTMGADALVFLEGLLETRRYGKSDAIKVVALLQDWEHRDVVSAIRRAARYKAFSPTVIERILSAQATPRSSLSRLNTDCQERLTQMSGTEPVEPRSTSAYQGLLDQSGEEADEGGRENGPHEERNEN